MKPASVSSKRGRRLVAALLVLFVLASSGLLSAGVAYAEGSRDLYPFTLTTGFRANLEWRTSYYGPNNFLLRRTLLQVYAEPGEVILLGSSAVGVGAGGILLYSSDQVTGRIGDETVPIGSEIFGCEAQRTGPGGLPGQGQITTRAQELAGPDTLPSGGVPGGYVPCFYEVPDGASPDNIYYVAFIGPSGTNADVDGSPTTGELDLASPANFDARQNTSISAWDVTVRSSLSSTTDITGRLFADYLSMITGFVSRPMNSTLYFLTTDAYIYEVGLRGLDPYGFVLYANDVGFLHSDIAIALYHDVLADATIPTQQQNQLNVLQGGVSPAPPTHHIFFNTPSPEARLALNGIEDPIVPLINSFVFEGVLGGNDTLPSEGGTFVLDVRFDVHGIYRVVISRDGVDFDPSNPSNRLLIGDGSLGSQQLPWDGLDNASNPFPVGGYIARVELRLGEVHFPLLDVENSRQGGPQYELINPPEGCPPFAGGCFGGFYNDRGYTTLGGTDVGTPGVPLPCPAGNPTGCNRPLVPNSDPVNGFDTRTADRAFGDGGPNGFGDKKGLDLWTYYPTQGETDIVIVQDGLWISQDSDISCYGPGESQIVNYTIVYANVGTEPALEATVTDTLPGATTFVSCSGAPCDETSPGSGVVVYSLGTLDAGTGGSLGLTVRVDEGVKTELTNRVRLEAANALAVEPPPNKLPCCLPPEMMPPPGPTPTAWATWTPIPPLPVVLLPETGDSPASTPLCWLWLPLLLLGLPAACVIRCRRG